MGKLRIDGAARSQGDNQEGRSRSEQIIKSARYCVVK